MTIDNSVAFPGLSNCKISVAGQVYPLQLAVNTAATAATFAGEKSAGSDAKTLTGLGDQAFTTTIGVEALRGTVDIMVTTPVMNNDYSIPIAITKAMIATLK